MISIVGMKYPFIPGLAHARTVKVGAVRTDRLILLPNHLIHFVTLFYNILCS